MFTTEETRATAQAVLDYIHEHPEKHNQLDFFGVNGCGTTMCIAGTVLFLEYGVSTSNQAGAISTGSYSDMAGPLLGLENDDETDWLFYEMDNELAIQKLKHLVVGEQPVDLTVFE